LAASDYAATSQAAATAAAAQHLQNGDVAGSKVFARQALATSAISAPALRSLGLAEQSLGHWQQAGAILLQASALGWRDGPIQLWLAAAMANRLALNPGWRPDYFKYPGKGSPRHAAGEKRAGHGSRALVRPFVSRRDIPAGEGARPGEPGRRRADLVVRSTADETRRALRPGLRQYRHGGHGTIRVDRDARVGGERLDRTRRAGRRYDPARHDPRHGILVKQTILLAPGPHRLGYAGSIGPLAHGHLLRLYQENGAGHVRKIGYGYSYADGNISYQNNKRNWPWNGSMRSKTRSRQQPLSNKAKLAGLIVGLLLGWQVVVISLAAGHGDYDTDLAASDYAATSQAAATAAAAQHLQNGDAAGSKVFARQALATSAISAPALRSLGLAEQSLGHWQQAGAILSQASALGWRDGPTQLWLAQAYLQNHEYAEAAQRLDALLRTDPSSTQLFDILDQLLLDPHLAAAMADRLALNPYWRSIYFQYPGSATIVMLQARSALIIDLARSSAPPYRDEILPLVRGLARVNQIASARTLWFEAQRMKPAALYDTGFANIGSTGRVPFEWTVTPVLGADVGTEPTERGGSTTLHVTTDGTASGMILKQMILLSPGSHRLSYTGSIDPSARDAFGWSIHCASTGKLVLDTLNTQASKDYGFVIPENCDNQFIELHAASSPAAAGSNAYFDRLELN
jgi:hypothetical protein